MKQQLPIAPDGKPPCLYCEHSRGMSTFWCERKVLRVDAVSGEQYDYCENSRGLESCMFKPNWTAKKQYKPWKA